MFEGGTVSIYVSDLDRAFGFYSEVLGLKVTEHFEGEWVAFAVGDGFVLGLHPARAGETAAPGTIGAINVELRVPKVTPLEGVINALRERGVRFKGDMAVYPHIKIATLLDPDGNEILIVQQP
ncbi:VOC family protein [Rhizobium laguerreae]|uniref:VOC family protein n=1 Tax=Rhizobium laguerreae TaxID=1076926 RepID=UPI001C91AF36|nr:VOC family protein [Rhizobium laguerreae]MBY3093324.1 VOC family protein [Rhizobium laguerreae]